MYMSKGAGVQHLINTKITLATCNRCGAYVLSSTVAGFKTMTNPSPLADKAALTAALIDGNGVYVVHTAAGRPQTLHPVSLDTPLAARLAEGRLVASHDCGTRHMNTTKIDATEVVPPKDSANTAAATATDAHHHSDQHTNCAICHKPIRKGEHYWGLDGFKDTQYFQHTECP